MQSYKKTIVSTSTILLLISGCSTTQQGISKIEYDKQQNNKEKINIGNTLGHTVYINTDNNIQYICTNKNPSKCNYYNHNKHSYTGTTPLEEYFYLSDTSYGANEKINKKYTMCGTQGLYSGFSNQTKLHPETCNSRFTEINQNQLYLDLGLGVVAYGLWNLCISGTTTHDKLSTKKLKEAIHISNIETFRKQLLSLINQYNVNSGIDIVYLEKNDIEDNLQDKYELLLTDKSSKDGVIFLEKNTNKLLGINIFNQYKDKNILEAISLQIEDLLNNIAKNNKYILKYEDIIPYIPKNVSLPNIPPVKKLIKDEFETNAKFNYRIKESIKHRENTIKNLQKKYTMDVFERNTYIDNLQNSYKLYLEHKAENKNELLKEIKNNIPLLSKVLFLENTSGYSAKDFKYDAENEKLYFNIYSKQRNFSQEVVSIVPPPTALS